MKLNTLVYRIIAVLFCSLFFISCLKKEYELPPDSSSYDPMLKVNTSIAQLKELNEPTPGIPPTDDTTLITTDLILSGIVIADDRSGNFFKSIVIQDESGGIQIPIDAASLYNDYPVGRKVYVKARGLVLGFNGGTPLLGFAVGERREILMIPGGRASDFIIKAAVGNTPKDTVISYEQAKNADFNLPSSRALLNRLVTVKDVQFADSSVTYTTPTGTTTRYLVDCGSDPMSFGLALRGSNFSKFFNYKVPSGNGSITGIYSRFNATPQLSLRDTSDVKLYNPRCIIGGGTTPGFGDLISIDSLRKMFNANSTAPLGNYQISGIVISDKGTMNIDSKNLILQDGMKGIVLRFTSSHPFAQGDSILVNVKGAFLIDFNSWLQVSGANFPISNAALKSTNKNVNPRILTIAQINANFENYESTLVKIIAATASGGAYYTKATSNTSRTLTDGTGAMILFTAKSATFGNSPLPLGAHSWTGILSQFGVDKHFSIRNESDVQ